MSIETLLKKIKFKIISRELKHDKYGKCYKYIINIKYNNINKNFSFTDSIYNYKNKKLCNFKDVLYGVLLDMHAYDDDTSLQDFAWRFGYSLDDIENIKNTKKIYNACHDNSKKMHILFNNDELNMLDEYFREY